MLGLNLTKNDKDLINVIFKYGGYIRVKHLKYLYPDMSDRTYSYKLDRLTDMGCLVKRRFINNSKSEPVTYQVTQLACRLCGNVNSTYRRKRDKEYAYRALLKNAFFLEVHKELESNIITDTKSRRNIFESVGFNPQFFPKKFNKDSKSNEDVAVVQFEEYLIDFRKNEGKKIVCGDEILYSDNSNGVVIVHIDHPHIEISKQIDTLINRYINMINQHVNNSIGFNINFLIIVDSDLRKSMYNDLVKKVLERAKYNTAISDYLLNLYKEYYNKLSKKDNSYDEFYNKIKQLYDDNKLMSIFIDKAKKFDVNSHKNRFDDVCDNVRVLGKKYVVDEIYTIMSESMNIDTARLKVEELFNILGYLEYKNIVYLGDQNIRYRYDVKIYKTCINIYGY